MNDKKFFIFPVLAFSCWLLYLPGLYFNSTLACNSLSILIGFFLTFTFFSVRNFKNVIAYHKQLLGVSLYYLTLTIGDAIWLYYENFIGINPNNVFLLGLIYDCANLIAIVVLISFFMFFFKRGYVTQVFVDLLFAYANFLFFFIVFKFKFDIPEFNNILSLLPATIYVLFNFTLFLNLVFLAIANICRKVIKSPAFIFMYVALICYIYTNSQFAYEAFNANYKATSMSEAVGLLADACFGLATLVFCVTTTSINTSDKIFNLKFDFKKRSKYFLVAMLIFYYILYDMKVFPFFMFLTAVIGIFYYWILCINIEVKTISNLMIQKEKENNLKLEELVSERTKALKNSYERQERILSTDPLTGLYNRSSMLLELNQLICNKVPQEFALFYMNINRFKAINDSYGHATGDKVLQAIALRFSKATSENLQIYRVASDEFALIRKNCKTKEDAVHVAEKIFTILREPLQVGSHIFRLTASVGVAMYPIDATDRETLMSYADISMYSVKTSSKKDAYAFFSQSISDKFKRNNELEFMLQKSVYDEEFKLFYQPQVNAASGELEGMEALIRWFHPKLGLIPPIDFISIAEKSGHIISLGHWIAINAIKQIKEWNEKYEKDLTVGINVSALQALNESFVDDFKNTIIDLDVNPKWIEMEITETIAMSIDLVAINLFKEISNMGISTAIDDFGTGYSSLSYIKNYQINRLKIAKELVDPIAFDETSLMIVRAIIMMAQGLKLNTIAEGVENEIQLKILQDIGCDAIQGYYLSKPLPKEEFEELFLKTNC